jgi:hypothetical protein
MFFKSYPQTLYNFGTEETATAVQDLSAYVDLIDQIKDNINFYEYLTIQDGERPDTLSQQIYGSVKYYWTFYLLNDSIRQNGWPLTTQEIVLKCKRDYPNLVLTTRDVNTLFEHFQIGDTIVGQSSGATGIIVKRNLELGQIFVSHNHDANDQEFLSGELIRDNSDFEFPQNVQIVSSAEGFEATHHYVDAAGLITDVDPYNAPSVLLTPVTYLERYQEQNTALKEIKIIKPGSIQQVYSAYQEALRSV